VLVWDEFLKIVREEVGSQVVETWFKAVVFERWDSATSTVILKVPNQFVGNWIQDHYVNLLKIHLARLFNTKDIKVFFLCLGQQDIIPAIKEPEEQKEKRDNALVVTPQTGNALIKDKKAKEKSENSICSQYLFENFIVGPSNSLAHAASLAICENLGKVYNPLFIYGGTGLGKTHLLHAIGNNIKKRNVNTIIRYQTTDHFMNEFINCIRFDKSEQFRAKYQKIDILLLDDIQFLSNKEQTQESFFHIFNTLYEQQKQIVLSSDTFPKEITGFQARLKSRLEWGLVADIQIPDLETKIAILAKKAEMQSIALPDDVADFIASRVISNIRELEGALVRVGAFAALTGQPVTLDLARRVLLNLSEKKREGILLDNVLKIVARHYGVSANDIKAKKRQKDIAVIRQVTLYLMKKLTFFSLQAIGEFVGGRDHSTVIHAVERIESMSSQDITFAQKLKAIEQDILTS
jgi:chromosomal replication initiator protein